MRKCGNLALALLLIVVLSVSVLAVHAQTGEIPDFLTQALDNLAELESYHFASESTVISEYIDADGMKFASTTTYSSEGSALKNGDNHTVFSVSGLSDAQETLTVLQVERIVANGTTYVSLSMTGAANTDFFDHVQGWWPYDDLRIALNDDNSTAALDTIIIRPIPSQSPVLRPDAIVSARERDAETLDGRAMRVFDIQYDALRLMQENPLKDQPGLADFFNNLDVMAAGSFHVSARLWIGADDAQLYRLKGSTKAVLPFLTSGHAEEFPYDLRQSEQVSITLSEHGQPVEISVPSPVHE